MKSNKIFLLIAIAALMLIGLALSFEEDAPTADGPDGRIATTESTVVAGAEGTDELTTLSGGVVTALGPWHAGLFASDDRLAKQLLDAGQNTGEQLWQLPLSDDLRKFMKGNHADMVNANEKRWAHAGQGAAFLSYFVGPDAPQQMPTIPWAHLDIAAVADTDAPSQLYTKGPTGFGVRLLIDWLAAQ